MMRLQRKEICNSLRKTLSNRKSNQYNLSLSAFFPIIILQNFVMCMDVIEMYSGFPKQNLVGWPSITSLSD